MTYALLAMAVSVPLIMSRAASTSRRSVLVGHAEDLGDHQHRQVLGEPADQVGLAARAELVDQLAG